MVDATNFIENKFIEKSLHHFCDKSILSVSGTLRSISQTTMLSRWRSRHLFKEQSIGKKSTKSQMMITYGTLISREVLDRAGGFNKNLRYKEDQELGDRIRNLNLFVVGDPNISIFCSKSNSLTEVLERYARWYMDINEKPSFRGYLHNIKGSFSLMIQKDLADGDYLSAFVSLLTPHFQLYYSFKQYLKDKAH